PKEVADAGHVHRSGQCLAVVGGNAGGATHHPAHLVVEPAGPMGLPGQHPHRCGDLRDIEGGRPRLQRHPGPHAGGRGGGGSDPGRVGADDREHVVQGGVMRRSTRTTLIGVGAALALVVAARSVPVHRRSGPAVRSLQPTMTVPSAARTIANSPRETATAAARRIVVTFATYPAVPLAEAEASLRGMASIEAMDHLVGELDAELARLAAGYPGGPTRVWHGVLATSETGSDDHARHVQVWFARVVAPPARPVYVEWRLASLDLLWERDGWRLNR